MPDIVRLHPHPRGQTGDIFSSHPMSWSTARGSLCVFPPREQAPDRHRDFAVDAETFDQSTFGFVTDQETY